VLAAAALPLSGAKGDDKPLEEQWLVDRSLTISPAPAPVPALKYRLFPRWDERKEGNAVPIYLRLVHEQNDASRRKWVDTPKKWNELPLDRLPVAEAKEFLKGYGRFLQQLDLGARRKRAEWNYTLDQGSPVDILLPDVQNMRGYMPLLILRARVEGAEGNYPAAVRSLATGIAFCRQVGDAPFLISGLVGIAGENLFTECVLDLVERPDAPNLYWALAELPRPLIDLRGSLEFEERMVELQFPDLADLDRPRSPAEWDAALARVRTELNRLRVLEREQKERPIAVPAPDEPADRSPDLPAARKYLTDRRKLAAAEVGAMPPARVLLLYIAGTCGELRDGFYKAAYLPFPEAYPFLLEAEKRLRAAPDGEAAQLARLMLAAIPKVFLAQVRLERKVALLRVIEALRLHAAAHGGLPEKLADITEAPVPDDPGTGKPFEYRCDGDTAVLASRIPGEPQRVTGIRYRITLRK
jgi:hypothetical protein